MSYRREESDLDATRTRETAKQEIFRVKFEGPSANFAGMISVKEKQSV